MDDVEITLRCRRNYILCAKGSNLIISHKKESETIPISKIQSVSLKEPGLLSDGVITFRTAQASTAGVNIGFGVSLAVGAEKTFCFEDCELCFASRLQTYITSYEEQQNVPAPESGGAKVISAADEIRSLKALLDDDIITREEFDAKKKQLLGI